MSTDEGVSVYTYPRGNVVYPRGGRSGPLESDRAFGLCSDAEGDVFVTTFPTIKEYRHGKTTPIAELTNPFGRPEACSVDPTTGNLAVVSDGGVAVFRLDRNRHWHLPRTYTPGVHLRGITYNYRGDLFVDGERKDGSFLLVELPNFDAKFHRMTVDHTIRSPGNLQYDGYFLVIASDETDALHKADFSRYKILDFRAQRVGFGPFLGVTSFGQFWVVSHSLVVPDYHQNKVVFYDYCCQWGLKTIHVTGPRGVTLSTPRSDARQMGDPM